MEMDTILKLCAAACGVVISIFTGIPPVLLVLIAVMSLDYATGLICGAMGRSPKTEHGGLSSKAAFLGILKKALVLMVVALAALLDYAVESGAGVEFAAVTGATCLWFIASEGVSVIENAAAMGVPVPILLKNALEVMRGERPDQDGRPPVI